VIDARLLQLCDSAFPSGGFSHSFGLETAILERRVREARDVEAWIASYLCRSAATLDGRAIGLFLEGHASLESLDEALSAAVFATDQRSASRRLARSTLDAYVTMGLNDDAIHAYAAALSDGRADGHHALACALGYRAIGASAIDAGVAYLSSTAAMLAAAAARAVPLGQRDIGRMLWTLRSAIETAAADAASARSLDDLTASAIPCEIDAMRHAWLDGRLFAS
jgi:urease accessory protein